MLVVYFVADTKTIFGYIFGALLNANSYFG